MRNQVSPRVVPVFSFVVFLFLSGFSLRAQAPPNASGAALSAKALSALAGGSPPQDITLSGTVQFMHGTHNEAGTATLSAIAGGDSQVVFTMPSGNLTEVWSTTDQGANIVTGRSANGRAVVASDSSITMPAPAWFAPALMLSRFSGSAYVQDDAGAGTHNGQAVDHLEVWRKLPGNDQLPAGMNPGRHDIYVDASTGLPASVVSPIEPYRPPNATRPLPLSARPANEEVRYSDYRAAGAYRIPYRVQVYLNQVEIIDIHISNVTFNQGISISPPA